jgi:RecA-family ATPase
MLKHENVPPPSEEAAGAAIMYRWKPGHSPAGAQQERQQERQEQPQSPDPEQSIRLIDPTLFEGQPVPAREWHVGQLIPHGTVTLLSGDGGTGKSLLALQLAVSTASATPWIGRSIAPGRAMLLSAEDDLEEIHRRLDDILAGEGAKFSDLANLRIAPLAGLDAVLATPGGKVGPLAATPLWTALVAHIEAFRPRLLVLDTLADLYAGEENNRAQVRQFVSMLRGLAIQYDMTVLLLSHPSLTGLSSGSGMSGSTAWNNSVRSRLYLRRATLSGGDEPDPDLRILETKKANYGTTGGEIALRWLMGRFVPEKGTPASAFDRAATETRADSLFLELLRAFADQGRHVSSKIGASFAPHLFAKDPRASGMSKRALEAAMQRLFAANRIRLETFGSPSRQVTRLVPCTSNAAEELQP